MPAGRALKAEQIKAMDPIWDAIRMEAKQAAIASGEWDVPIDESEPA